jgi:hypothetical protein
MVRLVVNTSSTFGRCLLVFSLFFGGSKLSQEMAVSRENNFWRRGVFLKQHSGFVISRSSVRVRFPAPLSGWLS